MSTGGAGRWLAIAATVVVVATVVAAVLVMGGPAEQRLVRLDDRRIDDLVRIEARLAAHAERTGGLPADLGVLAAHPGLALPLAGPDGTAYDYEPLDDLRYRLCAVFATDTARRGSEGRHGDDWSHGPGRQCFERRASPPAAAVPVPAPAPAPAG